MLISRFVLRAILAGLAVAAIGATARAQSITDAEQLFRDGKRLMAERKYAEACAAFAASETADPNVATLMNLADCREKNGQLASAWGHFVLAGDQLRADPSGTRLLDTAVRRAAALEGRLSSLVVEVAAGHPEGLVISRNGEVMEPGAWNRPLAVDGGDYVIEARAPDHVPWSTRVTVAVEGDRQSVTVPPLERRLTARRMSPAATPSMIARAPARPPPALWTPQRTLATGIAGAGVAALAAGAVLGWRARGLEHDAEATCVTGACTADQAGQANHLLDHARGTALGANVAFAAGAVAIAGGAALWIFGAPKVERDRVVVVPSIDPARVGLTAVLRF